jgi:hypothetical protein
MQPGPSPEYQHPASAAQQPAAGWPPPGHWGTQPSGAATAPPHGTVQRRTGRPGLVLLVALLVEIIVIAAADNQSIAQRVSDAALDHQGSLGYDFALALLTFQWRFSPAPGDRFHTLYGQWVLIGVLLVVTALLVLLVARAGAGFARVFFGTWAAVVAATGLGAIARAASADHRLLGGKSRFQYALFSDIGPSQYVFVAGLGLGLLVALAAGLTAVAARRDTDTPAPPRSAAVAAVAAPPQDDAPTTQFERGPDLDATRQFRPPAAEPDPAEQFRSPRDAPPEPEPTQATRRETPAEPDPAEQFRSPRDTAAEPEPTQATSRETPAEPEPTQAMPRVEDERRER